MRKGPWMVFVIMLLLAFSACQTDPDITDPDIGDDEAEMVLLIADSNTPDTLDTDFVTTDQGRSVGGNAYRQIVQFDVKPFEDDVSEVDLEQGVVGDLAESWERSDDGLTYTFTLREGVVSPFGNELTTEDVAWSLERTLEVGGVGPSIFALVNIDRTNPFTIIDERNFQIHLTADTPVFMALFGIPHYQPVMFDTTEVKKHVTDDDPWARDWLKAHTAGFGPYHVETFSPGQEVVWVKNPNYYEGDLEIDRIIQRMVPEESTRLSLLQAGEVDVAMYLGPRSLEEAERTDGVRVLSLPGNLGLILGLNNEVPPFDQRAVRQAVAYAMPVEDIIEGVYLGREFVRDFRGYVPTTYPWAHQGDFDYWPYSHDPAKAREMIEAAGAEGATATLSINATAADHDQAAVLIRDALAEIGLNIRIEKLTPARYQEQYFERKAEMVLVEDVAWVVDPAFGVVLYFDPSDAGLANWVNYSNRTAARQLEAANKESDPDRRLELSGEAYRTIVEDAPWSAYIGTGFHLAGRDDIGGLVWRTDNLLDFKYLYKK